MQQVATTPDEADEVCVAAMAGLLNGAFTHHLGQGVKEALKAVFRNSAIPFPEWVEFHDA
jgi:hypothetical protein